MERLTVCIAVAALLVATAGPGQCGSPYSANGIGTVVSDDFGISRGMGGAGVALADNGNMMRSNPGLLATFDNHVYALGVAHLRNDLDGEARDIPVVAETKPELFRLVLPITGGVVFGWGLSPYSRTNVNIGIPGDGYTDVLISTGGINVSTTGLAWSFRDIVYVGAALNYMFGTINEDWKREFPEDSVYENTTNYLKKKYRAYAGSAGILVRAPYGSMIGLSYTQKADLKRTIRVRPADLSNPEVEYMSDTRYLPRNLRIGLTSALGERLTAAASLSFTGWEDAAVTPTEERMYNDTWNFGAGLRFIPETSITDSYVSKLPLSAGFRMGTQYYKSYPTMDAVSEWALTAGIEFPFLDGMGSVVTSFEAGRRGDKSANGWQETFYNASITLVGAIE